jgi:hypothetical protein
MKNAHSTSSTSRPLLDSAGLKAEGYSAGAGEIKQFTSRTQRLIGSSFEKQAQIN